MKNFRIQIILNFLFVIFIFDFCILNFILFPIQLLPQHHFQIKLKLFIKIFARKRLRLCFVKI